MSHHQENQPSTQSWLFISLLMSLLICITGYAKEESDKCGYLGVVVDDINRQEKKELGITHGIVVVYVEDDSPAEIAGIQKEDIIQFYNDHKIQHPEDLVCHVRKTEPESKATLKLNRQGKQETVEVVIGEKTIKKHTCVWDSANQKLVYISSEHVYLGVKLQTLNSDLAEYFNVNENGGALILEVMEDSPAEKAGLKSGDIIVSLDNSPVETPKDVIEVIQDFKAGDKIDCKFMRKSTVQSIIIELAEKCSSAHRFYSPEDFCHFKHFRVIKPNIVVEEIKIETEKMKENLKDLEKEIQIKIKGNMDTTVI